MAALGRIQSEHDGRDVVAGFGGAVGGTGHRQELIVKPARRFRFGGRARTAQHFRGRFPGAALEQLRDAIGHDHDRVAGSERILLFRAAEFFHRAVAAQESGVFDREIVPVTVDGTQVGKDDGPRADSTLEKLASLKPAFKEDGTVTAGNSCPLNDGAAAALIMSADRAAELGLKPRARIITAGLRCSLRP